MLRSSATGTLGEQGLQSDCISFGAGGVTGGPCSVTQDPPRMISVLSRTNGCVGFLRSAGPKGFTAYDADGQPLGLFAEKQAAIEAITAAST